MKDELYLAISSINKQMDIEKIDDTNMMKINDRTMYRVRRLVDYLHKLIDCFEIHTTLEWIIQTCIKENITIGTKKILD